MEEEKLTRSLSARHIQMIALGGTIGVGLFMGASSTIRWTGPSVMVAYAVAGFFLYLIMRALGEMLYLDPSTGSFANYASEYIHPVAGYLTAWSNIFQFIVVGISEVIAVGEYMNYWWPDLPQIIPGIVVILFLMFANLVSVKAFGELEFWFSTIKVVTIILMIIAGLGIILFGFGNHGEAIGISNLWKNGGFFTGGVKGFFFALSIVVASYQGIELIGMTAGEAKDPQKTIVDAVQSTIGRILIFYIGAIFIIVSIYPWNQLSELGSPFVQTFSKIGITFAAGLINFVVITAALSGCNSGIFSASRMVYTLAINGKMSKKFLKLTRHGVPFYPVVAISFGILIGLILNYLLPFVYSQSQDLFVFVYSSSILPGMVPWIVILISQIKFRKKHPIEMLEHPFKMPLSPYTNYLSLAFLAVVLIFMFINPETKISLMIGLIFLIYMTGYYFVRERKIKE
ncbi:MULTISPECIES: amino acid permease [Enterococcus]|uniref:amino acid permease n=1 Tax=Enterococcus TaxID=1350 RepID=UPI00032FA8FD|nr:amino acid permease [Enterococcus mundtii]EOH60892.1 amino acid permease [Enterococcus mundtii ATCC 882]EOU11884.1 amino acid permease [Enterococcus mundtii ATCC 882]MBE9911627.1 amino acid permease [Enterococcus mundtii]MRI74710.1 amino acid permease [Enterococcus mundtii]PJK24861.1 amino acid permease [Enterococcus mundtii]